MKYLKSNIWNKCYLTQKSNKATKSQELKGKRQMNDEALIKTNN